MWFLGNKDCNLDILVILYDVILCWFSYSVLGVRKCSVDFSVLSKWIIFSSLLPPQGIINRKYKCLTCVHINPKSNKLRNTLGWNSLVLCQVISPSRWVLSLFLNLGNCFLFFSCVLQEAVLLKKLSASSVGMRLACRNCSIWPVVQSVVMKRSSFYIKHLQNWIKSGLQQAAVSQTDQFAVILRQLDGKLSKAILFVLWEIFFSSTGMCVKWTVESLTVPWGVWWCGIFCFTDLK